MRLVVCSRLSSEVHLARLCFGSAASCISVAVGREMLLVSLDLIVPFFTMVRFQADIRNIIQQSFATYTCSISSALDTYTSTVLNSVYENKFPFQY